MRKPFERQIAIGTVPMRQISFDIYCRHELVPILMALKHIYSHKPVFDEILDLIKNDVIGDRNDKLGCSGMNYWDILVLAAVRLGCNLDYDALHDLANNHMTLRDIMRISRLDDKRFPRATIHDNLTKLSPATIINISDIIIDLGHKFYPKAIERVRGDSFVVQKNIHYPTDANLIFDGVRKSIELSIRAANAYSITGWKQNDSLLKKIKQVLRKIQKTSRSKQKNKEEQLKSLYQELIERVHRITSKCLDTISTLALIRSKSDPSFSFINDPTISEIMYYLIATQNMCELAERRVLEGEQIPHSEKIFSLFEPFTELINRGKTPYPIEFGHRVFIVQDSAGFIVHSQVMGIGVTDEKVLVDAMKKLQDRFNDRIRAASFDKGFWTPNNLKELSGIVPLMCLPKKGKRSKADQEREGAKEFGKMRKWHPGIESAINGLGSGNGLIVCRDKDEEGYERYVALGILGRNLQTLGTIFLNIERKKRRIRVKAA
jgi:IS5 family transposase